MLGFKKKIVYFIRHGESANNASNVRQGSSGGLSDKGKAQARFVGERFKNFPIDIIIASPYERTKETAALINETLKKPLEYSDLLVERKNPSEIVGKDANSEEVRKIIDVIDRGFHENNLRYSDEENFQDLKTRAIALLDFLERRKEDRIICVSHRIFLKMVVSYIEDGDALDSHEFVKLDFLNKIQNGATIACKFDGYKKWRTGNGWEILAFNDYPRTEA